MFDSAPSAGQGASFANSGMLHPSQVRPWFVETPPTEQMLKLFDMACHSQQMIDNRLRKLGLADKAKASGCLQLFDSQYLGEAARSFYESLAISADIYRGEWDFQRYALRFPGDGASDSHHYCQALTKELSERGAIFEFGNKVSLSMNATGVIVRGGDTDFKADHIIVATGASSAKLLEPLGLSLPVVPVAGHALNFSKPDTDLPAMPIMHAMTRSALTVFDDHVRLSGTVGEENPLALLDIWEEIAPDLIEKLGTPISSWTGDRPVSRSGFPIIGPSPIKGLWINSGHGHMGWTLCAGAGAYLADQIVGVRAGTDFPYFE